MNRKVLVLILFIALLAANASAFWINTDKESYEKGEAIKVTTDSAEPISVEIYKGRAVIATGKTEADGNGGKFTYSTLFSDPPGEWTVRGTDGSRAARKKITINTPQQGAYLIITIYSPSEGEYKRSRELETSIEITDLGKTALGANVFLYGVHGKKIEMEQTGPGRYFYKYVLPFDAPLGETSITIAAQLGSGETAKGGEHTLRINVLETPILIEVLRPTAMEIPLGTKTEIVVRPTYFNGLPVDESTEIYARVDGEFVPFERQANGEYLALYAPQETGELKIEIEAQDKGKNLGSKRVTTIVGREFEHLLRKYGLIIIQLVVLAIILIQIFRSKFIKGFWIKQLEKKRDKFKDRLRRLQEKYYKKGTISVKTFEKESAKYKHTITETEEKIKALKGKK